MTAESIMKFVLFGVFYFAALVASSEYDVNRFVTDVIVNTWDLDATDNLVISPFSLLGPLGALAFASNGSTRSEILDALKIPSTAEVKVVYKKLNEKLQGFDDARLIIANKMYLSKFFKVNPLFKWKVAEIFDVEFEKIKFQPSAAAEINDWVSNKTNCIINNLVEEEDLNVNLLALLINTIYFDAKWKYRFTTVKKDTWHIDHKKTMEVDMMSVDMYLRQTYIEGFKLKVLEIPYQEEKCSFVVVLPEIGQLDILNLLLTIDNNLVTNALQNMTDSFTHLSLPWFTTTTTTDLIKVLQKLNIKQIFTTDADLSNLVKDLPLKVDKAYQKAFINVNLLGTRAGAASATEIVVTDTGRPVPETKVDRPFYFEIRCSEISLFNGIVVKPEHGIP